MVQEFHKGAPSKRKIWWSLVVDHQLFEENDWLDGFLHRLVKVFGSGNDGIGCQKKQESDVEDDEVESACVGGIHVHT